MYEEGENSETEEKSAECVCVHLQASSNIGMKGNWFGKIICKVLRSLIQFVVLASPADWLNFFHFKNAIIATKGMHSQSLTHTHTCTHAHAHTHMHTNTHIHTHMHTHTHTHKHTH